MLIIKLPDECFLNILSFLDNRSLYNCLFVNRYYCRFSIPIIWKEPFTETRTNFLIIPTLLACLNNNEKCSLVPYTINFPESNPPLFEYGSFVRYVDHELCVEHIIDWLIGGLSTNLDRYLVSNYNDCRVQGLVNAIYHMIMRQGSIIKELKFNFQDNYYVELPKPRTFKKLLTPGITNLRSLNMSIECYKDDAKSQNAIEFLRMVPIICNAIVEYRLYNYELNSAFVEPLSNIIKSQPLKRLFIFFGKRVKGKDAQKILHSLEFCPEAFKELLFNNLNFQDIDLTFMLRLGRLDRLEMERCAGFTSKSYGALVKKQLHLKELKLWFKSTVDPLGVIFYPLKITSDTLGLTLALINSFGSEMLVRLTLDVVTLEIAIALKKLCQNIRFLHIKFSSVPGIPHFDLRIISLICELQSLKTLHIQVDDVNTNLLIETLGDHLTSVEYLFLNFRVDLSSFQYFTGNCRAKLKKWNIMVDRIMRGKYLAHVDAYQVVHNSLKVLGVNEDFTWSVEEMKFVNSLNCKGVEVVLYENLRNLFS